MAALYYLPFQCGMSLHFRFSGQSIPNRAEIKDLYGVKIFFDPVSTAKRIEKAKILAEKIVADSSSAIETLDAIDSIVYHIAAHEVGHAIYGLDHVRKVIKAETKTLLEEPRAELTALFTMNLLFKNKVITESQLASHLKSFAIQDLRRYESFESSATRPYTISAINTYKVYEKTGYVTLTNDKIVFDDNRAPQVLNILSDQFKDILKAEDELNGQALEDILTEMQEETTLTKYLVWAFKAN